MLDAFFEKFFGNDSVNKYITVILHFRNGTSASVRCEKFNWKHNSNGQITSYEISGIDTSSGIDEIAWFDIREILRIETHT